MDPLGTLLSWVAARGLVGLLAVTATERLIPIMPSYAMLVAVGIAAAQGHWTLPTAILVSLAGGLLGVLLYYVLGTYFSRAFEAGTRRSRAVDRATRLLGVSPANVDRLIARFRSHDRICAFCSQLIPGVRLVAPAVAGLLRVEARGFLIWTTLGMALWNLLFIGVGYGAALTSTGVNSSTLAVKTVLVLVIAECAVAGFGRWVMVRRRVVPVHAWVPGGLAGSEPPIPHVGKTQGGPSPSRSGTRNPEPRNPGTRA